MKGLEVFPFDTDGKRHVLSRAEVAKIATKDSFHELNNMRNPPRLVNLRVNKCTSMFNILLLTGHLHFSK